MSAIVHSSVQSLVASHLTSPLPSPAVRTVIIEAVNRIIVLVERRSDISRATRSALAPKAQPYQDLIDKLFFAIAGLTDAEAAALEERLATML